ncbi:hypothetical protein [Nocardia carnea]|uniref:hypothetical protein n=1 Tax=Nocardia carnea TaxID=37328 RepID=UPI002456CA10|nr:hypothetical protein [Nocardia carnea]
MLFETEVDTDRIPAFSAAPLELILVEKFPDVCSEHGLPSVESRPFVVNSMGMPGSELPTLRVFLRSITLPARPQRNYGFQARVRFEYPACELCLREIVRSRRIALLALLAVVLTGAALAAAIVLGVEQLYIPLGLAAVPGCFPVALAVAVIAWTRSGYFADVWLSDTTDHLIVSAHPDFATAVDRRRAGSH